MIHRLAPVSPLIRAIAFGVIAFGVIAFSALVLTACGAASSPVTETTEPSAAATEIPATAAVEAPPTDAGSVYPPEGRPELLSEWQQLTVTDGHLVAAEGVTPYTLNSALFSDYAEKLRTVWLPEGDAIATYQEEAVLDFPVGTVITKTFWYPLAPEAPDRSHVQRTARPADNIAAPIDLTTARLIETRVLVHRADGWEAFPYVWNDEQTEAELKRSGDLIRLTMADTDTTDDAGIEFPYVVPNVNQCSACHTVNHTTGAIAPIGPKARHLNRDVDLGDGAMSQLELWQSWGILGEIPDLADIPAATVWDDDTAPLEERARAYLDINCAHCHNREGPADTSGLFLEATTELGVRLGVCKPPVAAGTGTGGRLVGISPGEAEDSIFVFRMETMDPGAMMPELGRALPHAEGIDLITYWIDSLAGDC